MNNINIIEIGGGYGGLCFYIYKMACFFNITIKTYNIFDLPEPMALQKKYLHAHGFENVNFMNLDDFENVKLSSSTSCDEESLKLPKDCFLVSNYAYSEISMDLQKKYTKYVLNPYVSHGF
jgi:translation elongation factor P/translation initiation factor 5A